MTMVGIGEGPWRMLRQLELHPNHPGPVPWAEFRGHCRNDLQNLGLLVRLGLVTPAGPDYYVLTVGGLKASALGLFDLRELQAARAAERAKATEVKRDRKTAAKRLRRKATVT